MNKDEIILRYLPIFRKHWLPLGLAALGMIFFAYGLIGLLVANKPVSDDIIFEASSGNNLDARLIFVDIQGAVAEPGLYKLPDNSRIQDGLVAAGGLSVKADRGY